MSQQNSKEDCATDKAASGVAAAKSDGAAQASSGSTARQAIQALLQTTTEDVPRTAILALMGMESRKLPDTVDVQRFDPRDSSRMCCFDTASLLPAWSAWSICARCRHLNQLIQSSAQHSSSEFMRANLGVALLTTDCVSEKQHKGSTAELSVELVDLIVECALDDMRQSGDGSGVAKLLHTSTLLRLKVVQAFTPPTLYDSSFPFVDRENFVGSLPRSLATYIADSLEWWLQDITLKRHKLQAPSAPPYREPIIDASGLRAFAVKFKLIRNPNGVNYGDRRPRDRYLVQIGPLCADEDVDDDGGWNPLDTRDLLGAFKDTLEQIQPFDLSINTHERALSGSLGQPLSGAVIVVRMLLFFESHAEEEDLTFDNDREAVVKSWCFDTVQVDMRRGS